MEIFLLVSQKGRKLTKKAKKTNLFSGKYTYDEYKRNSKKDRLCMGLSKH